ncbi:MAG: GNAT family N-acetyltransferase [Holophagaceae bacterium]|nr:GNAT family N-acetyltransferase [Holophagaceae bacterium]
MSRDLFRIVLLEQLDAVCGRIAFSSGSAPLDRYFHQQVTQDIRRRVTACFVALSKEEQIAGYYTLASASILLNDLPATIRTKLPRYPSVPAIRMGRLAIDSNFQGQGLGGALLADALHRAVHSEIAAFAMVVDAKDNSALAFYRHHGFISFPDSPRTLFLPLKTVTAAQRTT